MIQSWKIPNITKGLLTFIPPLNTWRLRRAKTEGSNSSRYCYSVWLRHLIMLAPHGFRVIGTRVGELGPGDSIGVGLAALLSGASAYVGLDVVPFSATADLEKILDELMHMYAAKEPIPDQHEFPHIRPLLDSYEFPEHLINLSSFSAMTAKIRDALRTGLHENPIVDYQAPWHAFHGVSGNSLDLIVSQAVLEHVDAVEETYQAMFDWLKPGGYASHYIDFSAHYLSPFWNGHWAYSDWEWSLVRGRREFLLNREPLSAHLASATKAGFAILGIEPEYSDDGLHRSALSKRFQGLDSEDARIRGVMLILQKR